MLSDDHSLPLVAFQLTTTEDGKERGYTACVLPLLHEHNIEGHAGHGCYVICDVQHDSTDRKERDYSHASLSTKMLQACQVPVPLQSCETTRPRSPALITQTLNMPNSISCARRCRLEVADWLQERG